MRYVKRVVRWVVIAPLEIAGLSVLAVAIKLIDWTDA